MRVRVTATWVAAIWVCSLVASPGRAVAAGREGRPALFSQLPPERQREILNRIEPPPTAQRQAPYSTPMYYLLAKGFADGPNNELLLDRNRPDWQEALIRDWVDLGLTSTLYCTGPTEWDDPDIVKAIRDYCALSGKYGLKVGVRLAGDGRFQGIDAGGWDVHPRNPKNRIEPYIRWTARAARELRGQVEYYVLGDELNSNAWEESAGPGQTRSVEGAEDRRWTPGDYMELFGSVARAIKSGDPQAKVCMFGMNGLDWKYLNALLKLGYAEYGDAVAANPDESKYGLDAIRRFVGHVRQANPKFALYSNGVGYIAARTEASYPINVPAVYKRLSDEEQAARVAQMMVAMFDVAWDRTPYYIAVRQWVLPDGRLAPHWYGIFGFCDLVVGKDDSLTIKHYPAWNALQTVAHVLHSRSETVDAPCRISLSEPVDEHVCYVRKDYECLIVLWNRQFGREITTSLTIPTARYTYPVQVPLSDWRRPVDLPYRLDGGKLVIPEVKVSAAPAIIRLVAEEQQFVEQP